MARDPDSVARAKRYRADMMGAEERLWRMLRDRRVGAKFRRQHPIGPYVVDFACVAARLVLEVDGASHDVPEQRAFDAERTAFLERAGWRVLRVPNAEVYAGAENVMALLEPALRPQEE